MEKLNFKHSNLELVTTTCTAKINTNCNVELIGNYTDINDTVLGVKYINSNSNIISTAYTYILKGTYIEKNNVPKPRKRKTRKEKVTKRKDFSNQCSLIVTDRKTNDTANVKIFSNGKLVVTGIKSSECLDNIIEYVQNNIINTHGHIEYKIPESLEHITTTFKNSKSILRLYDISSPHIHYITQQLSTVNPFTIEITDVKRRVYSYFLIFMLIKYIGIETIFDLIKRIYDKYITHQSPIQFDNSEQQLIDLMIKYLYAWDIEKECISGDFSAILSTSPLPDIEYTQIESINSTCTVDFNIDRLTMNNMLNDTYKLTKEQILDHSTSGIISSQFNPTVFHGINITYRLVFSQFDQLKQFKLSTRFNDKYDDMKYRDITVFIFRNGKINITSMIHEGCSHIIQDIILYIMNDLYQYIYTSSSDSIQSANDPLYKYIIDIRNRHTMYVHNSLIPF